MDCNKTLLRCLFRNSNEDTSDKCIFHILSNQKPLGGIKPNENNSGSQNTDYEWVWLFYVMKESLLEFKLCTCNVGESEIKNEESLEGFHEFLVPSLSVDQVISLELRWNEDYESAIISIDDIINQNEELFEKLAEMEFDYDGENTDFGKEETIDLLSTNKLQECYIKVSPRIKIKMTTESMDSICGSSSEVEEIMSHQINTKRNVLIPSKNSSSDPVSSGSDRLFSDIPSKVTELPEEDEVFVFKTNEDDSLFLDSESLNIYIATEHITSSTNESNDMNVNIIDIEDKDMWNKNEKIYIEKNEFECCNNELLKKDDLNVIGDVKSNFGFYDEDEITQSLLKPKNMKTKINLYSINKMQDVTEADEQLQLDFTQDDIKRDTSSGILSHKENFESESNYAIMDNDEITHKKKKILCSDDENFRNYITNDVMESVEVNEEINPNSCCILSFKEMKENVFDVEITALKHHEKNNTLIDIHDENESRTKSLEIHDPFSYNCKLSIIEEIAEELVAEIFSSINLLENEKYIEQNESKNDFINVININKNLENFKENETIIKITMETFQDKKENNQQLLHCIKEKEKLKLIQGIYEEDSFFNVPISRSLDAESNDSSIVTSLSKDSLEYMLNDTQNENSVDQKNMCVFSSKENCTEKTDELPLSFLSQAANQMFSNHEFVCDNNNFLPIGKTIDRLKNQDMHFTHITFSYPNTNDLSSRNSLPDEIEFEEINSTRKYLIYENQTDNNSRINPMLCVFINKNSNELIRNQVENNKNNMERKTCATDKYLSFDTSFSSNKDSAVVCDSDSQSGRGTIIADGSYDEFTLNYPMTTSQTVDSLFISTMSSNKQINIQSQDTLSSEETNFLLNNIESNNKNVRPTKYCSLPIPPRSGLKRSPALEGVCDLLKKTDEELKIIQHRINLVNDDDLFPDSVTPTKADSSLRSEASVYDISYIDDEPYSEDDLSFINNHSKKCILQVKLAECDECTLSSEIENDKLPHKEIISPISMVKAKHKKNKLFQLFGCFSKNKN